MLFRTHVYRALINDLPSTYREYQRDPSLRALKGREMLNHRSTALAHLVSHGAQKILDLLVESPKETCSKMGFGQGFGA